MILAAALAAAATAPGPYVAYLQPGCVWDNRKPVEVVTLRPGQPLNVENLDRKPRRFSLLPEIPIGEGDLVGTGYRAGVHRVTACDGRARLIVSVHPRWRR